MNTPLEQFVREQIQRARTELSYQDALDFLRGVCNGLGDRLDEIARFRETVMHMTDCDRQLVLIADGQLRLDFADALCLPVFRTPAERLQWARRHRKLPLYKLADKSGIAMTRISEYANGREMSMGAARQLENALNLPPSWLLTGAEQQPIPQAA